MALKIVEERVCSDGLVFEALLGDKEVLIHSLAIFKATEDRNDELVRISDSEGKLFYYAYCIGSILEGKEVSPHIGIIPRKKSNLYDQAEFDIIISPDFEYGLFLASLRLPFLPERIINETVIMNVVLEDFLFYQNELLMRS